MNKNKIMAYMISGLLMFSLGCAGGYVGTTIANKNQVSTDTKIVKTSAIEAATTDISVVAESASPSVVAITTETVQLGSFMRQSVSEGAGSGVIITNDGYIITNHHVVSGARSIQVTLADNTTHEAELVGSDATNDIAVIKIDATNLTVAAIGNSDHLKIGEDAIVIGNPLGTLGGTVTEGIISATSRTMTIDNVEMNLLQTSAAVNPGNSGGGLFNSNGELVGIVNAKISDEDVEGIGFAIPINQAIDIAEQIIDNGGFANGNYTLGITMIEIKDEETARRYNVDKTGIYVYSVVEGSDAEEAGIKSGDRLVSVNGTKVNTTDSAKSLIKSSKKGDTLKIVVDRNGKEKTFTIKI